VAPVSHAEAFRELLDVWVGPETGPCAGRCSPRESPPIQVRTAGLEGDGHPTVRFIHRRRPAARHPLGQDPRNLPGRNEPLGRCVFAVARGFYCGTVHVLFPAPPSATARPGQSCCGSR